MATMITSCFKVFIYVLCISTRVHGVDSTTTTAVIPLVETATVATPLVEEATQDTPLVGTEINKTPLVDTTPEFQLVDTSPESPLVDTANHETPLVDTAPHETPLVDTATTITPMIDTVTLETPLVDTLNNVIAKQIVLCGYDSLCTIQNPTKPFAHLACCETCSCNSDCLANHNCCVDYVLKLVYGNVTFNSIDDIHIALTNVTTNLEIETLLDKMYMHNDSALGTEPEDSSTGVTDDIECTPVQVVHDRVYRGTRKYHELITGCTKSLYSRNGCLKSDMEPDSFFGNIPVTSISSGKTYKNKTLFDCCGDTNETFEYWDMFVECNMVTSPIVFSHTYVPHPFGVLKSQNLTPRCNVVFEPTDHIRNRSLVPRECIKVEIDTCTVNPSSKADIFLNNFCESERQFVKVMGHHTYTIYNNAACVMCNQAQYTADTKCEADSVLDDAMKLRVDLDDVPKSKSAIEAMSDGGFLNTRDMPMFSRYSTNCSYGCIYVPLLEECRRLYCPRSMYIVNGSCVPLYDHVTCATFRTAFNMTIISPITADLEKASFERALTNFLNKEHFSSASLSIERVRMINHGHTYMVEMLLSTNKTTGVIWSSVVEAVTSWYFTTIDIHVSDTTVVEMGISPGILSYFSTTHLRINRARKSIRDVRKASNTSHAFNYIIDITEVDICYRIGLTPTSFIVSNKQAFKVPLLNETIFRENMDILQSSSGLLVCADLFVNRFQHFHVNLKSRVKPDERLSNQMTPVVEDERSMLLLLIVIVGVVGVVLCVVCRLLVEKVSVCMARFRENGDK